MKAIRVQFKPLGKRYFFGVGNYNLTDGAKVIVNTIRGIELGYCVGNIFDLDEKNLTSELKDIVRIATEDDISQNEKNKSEEALIVAKTKELAKNRELDMKTLECEYTLDRAKLIIYFESEGRVDFRELVRDLAEIYHTRIELRQVGVRDKAKRVGGLGPCGLFLCCNSFLADFNSVSINMAKNQMLALNPTKINGLCGRLLCCLGYENDTYTEMKKDLPKIGLVADTPLGMGKVVSVDIFKKTYSVDLKDQGIVTFEKESDK